MNPLYEVHDPSARVHIGGVGVVNSTSSYLPDYSADIYSRISSRGASKFRSRHGAPPTRLERAQVETDWLLGGETSPTLLSHGRPTRFGIVQGDHLAAPTTPLGSPWLPLPTRVVVISVSCRYCPPFRISAR